ncbi:hypothetical protein M5E88_18515 [Akkermansia muciniphila]|nr:hypothetical protein M5E88_18515 [Akkermansia muciniphila]
MNKKYIGQVEAIDRVTVQPRVSGNIVATRFREGKVVKKGISCSKLRIRATGRLWRKR